MKKRKYQAPGEEVLGVDVGGVIIDRVNDGTDTAFFGENFLETTPVPEVFTALRRLADERFGTRIYIVSKAGPKTAEKTRRWMAHNDFYSRTGIGPSQLYFTLSRQEKAPVCAQLRITHFIDDHLEVHEHLKGIVPYRFLFTANQEEDRANRKQLRKASGKDALVLVYGWRQMLDALLD